jgi:hypothetical protein
MDSDDERYVRGELSLCHICHKEYAVTSDSVCGDCATKHPLPPKIKPSCPSCASLRADYEESGIALTDVVIERDALLARCEDVEGMAKVVSKIYDIGFSIRIARAVSAWLKEKK